MSEPPTASPSPPDADSPAEDSPAAEAPTLGPVAAWPPSRGTLLAGTALLVVHGPPLIRHAATALDPWVQTDDALQQIAPLLRSADPSLFPGDAIVNYYLDHLPTGFRLLYATVGVALDPPVLSALLPPLLLVLTAALLAWAAWRAVGPWAAWLVAGLSLGNPQLLERMAGGLPRAFAYPLLAAAAAALVAGRPGVLLAALWGSAALYPAAAVPAGLALAAWALLLPARDRGPAAAWSLRRRAGAVALAAAGTALLALPSAVGGQDAGPLVRFDQVEAFPEVGPGGRYDADSRAPFPSVLTAIGGVAPAAVVGGGDPWPFGFRELIGPAVARTAAEALLLVACLACAALAGGDPRVRRLAALAAASVVAYVVACQVAPYLYLPQRHVLYPLPVVLLLVLPIGISAALARAVPANRRTAAGWAAALAILLTVGGRGNPAAGLTIRAHGLRPLYQALAELPKDSLIAGFPLGPLDGVPYFARRSILVGYETHQAFHSGYALAMRERARATFAAYFATDPAPVFALRETFGVTHILVDQAHWQGAPARYFEPFSEEVAVAQQRALREGFVLQRWAQRAAIYRDARYVVIDLTRAHRGATADGAGPAGAPGRPTALEAEGQVLAALAPRLTAPTDDEAALEAWRPKARAALLENLHADPAPEQAAPLDPQERGRTSLDGGVVRVHLDYAAADGFRIPAYLYLPPRPARAPGVLCWHGHHDAGKASAAVSGRPLGYGEFSGALDLARAGFVVLTPDVRSFGETGNVAQHVLFTQVALAAGRPAIGLFLSDAWRALDVLALQDEVDPERLGVAGFSLGGRLALLTGATDARVRAIVAEGYLCSTRDAFHATGRHCPCDYTPGLAALLDVSDVALLAAPKPLLFVTGDADPEFPIAGARRAFEQVAAGYARLGAPDRARLSVHPGAHAWRSEPAVAWLEQALGQ